jgi:hypothetical protein
LGSEFQNGYMTIFFSVRPQAVINELTSLPSHYTPAEMKAAAERDRKVRTEGNANLWRRSPMLACSDTCCNLRGSGMPQARAWRMRRRRLPSRRRLGSQPARERTPNWSRQRCTARVWNVLLSATDSFTAQVLGTPAKVIWASSLRQRQVPVIGAGQGVWSFVDIEDAAAATVAALECAPGAYNVVDGDPVPQRVWLPAFARIAGAPEPPLVTEEAALATFGGDTVYYATRLRGASNEKANRLLGSEREAAGRARRRRWP